MPISNIRNRLHFYSETVWGTKPATPTLVMVPHTAYGVQLRPERRNAAVQTGLRQRKHGRTFRGTVTGPLTCPLYAWKPAGLTTSLAQYLMDWSIADAAGTLHEAIDLPSKGAEYAEGPDVANKDHSGLRVNSATLSGNGDAGTLELSLDLMGKNEAALVTAAAIPTNLYELTEFEFVDCTYEIDTGGGYVAIALSSWQLTVANNLRSDYVGGYRPGVIAAGPRVVGLQINFPKNDDTWDELRRDITSGTAEPTYKFKFTLKGLHKGSGTALTNWTQVVLTMESCKYASHDDQRSRDDFARLPLAFDVMKPDTVSNDVGVAWTDIA